MDEAQQFSKAVDFFQNGELRKAENALQRLGALASTRQDVLHLSGLISLESGQYPKAIECFERLLGLVGREPDILKPLAVAYQKSARLDDALKIAREIHELEPDSIDQLSNLAYMLLDSGQAHEAAPLFERVVQLDASFSDAYFGLGQAALKLGDPDTACGALEEAVRRAPGDGEAKFWCARALYGAGDWPRAVALLRQTIALQPDFIEAHCDLGKALADLGDTEAAKRAYHQALILDPDCPDAHSGMGTIQLAYGERSLAEQSFRKALSAEPGLVMAHINIADCKKFLEFDADAEALAAQLRRPELDDIARTQLCFALGKIYEDIGEYDQAFEQFERANGLYRQGLDYDVAADEGLVDGLIASVDKTMISRHRSSGFLEARPIFIVGMPRSATTLVEQILASHSAVHGAGELDAFEAVLRAEETGDNGNNGNSVLLSAVRRLDATGLGALGKAYDARTRILAPTAAQRVTDKMPANFLFLGLIAMALPNAVIIHCVRDPVDVCLSCFKRLFLQSQPYSYDLVELGRFYKAYEKIMAHWRTTLPNRFIDVVYEDLVTNPEKETRRLVAHCGLAWENQCLDFHKTNRPILTNPTHARQPIYKDAVKRWKNYEAHLGPLLEILRR
jgi:tetratricopeptide (TPR) repeat protein